MNKENIPLDGRIVIIEGNISAGKSTLSRELARELGYEVFLEPTLKNPYLEAFYKEPKKYALKLQLWILRQRFKTYISAVKTVLATGKGVILDRSVYSDCVFAEKNYWDENITKNGYLFYQALQNKMLAELPVPHLTLYLDVPPQACYDRVHQMRGRACESGIPLDYLEGLDKCYQNFVGFMEEQGSTILRLNWRNFGQPHRVADMIKNKMPNKTVEEWAGNIHALRSILNNKSTLRQMMVLSYRLDGVEDDEEGTELDAGVTDVVLDGEDERYSPMEELMDLSVADSDTSNSILMDMESVPPSPSVSSVLSPGSMRASPPRMFSVDDSDELHLMPSPIRPPVDSDFVSAVE